MREPTYHQQPTSDNDRPTLLTGIESFKVDTPVVTNGDT